MDSLNSISDRLSGKFENYITSDKNIDREYPPSLTSGLSVRYYGNHHIQRLSAVSTLDMSRYGSTPQALQKDDCEETREYEQSQFERCDEAKERKPKNRLEKQIVNVKTDQHNYAGQCGYESPDESGKPRICLLRSSTTPRTRNEMPLDRRVHSRVFPEMPNINHKSLEARLERLETALGTPPLYCSKRSDASDVSSPRTRTAGVDTQPSSQKSGGTDRPRVRVNRDWFAGDGAWPETEQRNRDRMSNSKSNQPAEGASANSRESAGYRAATLLDPVNRPVTVARHCEYEISWGKDQNRNVITGWMPPLPTCSSVKSWVEEIAYEAACLCGGDENVQSWILDVIDIDHDGYDLRLPVEPSWRALDIGIADEIKMLVNKAGDKYQTVRGNITLLKRRAMRERRLLGGREMMVTVINSYGPLEKRNSINDLMQLKAPSIKTLEQFYIDWKDIMVDIDERDHVHEIKPILEQKLDESQLFDHELRTIDLWEIPDSDTYRTYIGLIKKRILKESRRVNENKRKTTVKTATEQHNAPAGDDDRKERKTQPTRRENLPPVRENQDDYDEQFEVAERPIQFREPNDPLSRFFGKGRGKGKNKGQRFSAFENPILKSPIISPHITPNRERLDDDLLNLSNQFGSCRDFLNGNCFRINCRFPHLTREELRSKQQ